MFLRRKIDKTEIDSKVKTFFLLLEKNFLLNILVSDCGCMPPLSKILDTPLISTIYRLDLGNHDKSFKYRTAAGLPGLKFKNKPIKVKKKPKLSQTKFNFRH